jgi:hypothetical protein
MKERRHPFPESTTISHLNRHQTASNIGTRRPRIGTALIGLPARTAASTIFATNLQATMALGREARLLAWI